MIGAASTPVRLRTGSRRRTPFWLLLPVLLLALLASLPLLYVAAQRQPGDDVSFFNDVIEGGSISMTGVRIG